MAKKQYVVGMDGGATKTAAMLSDLKGVVLAEETGGASNPQVVTPEKTAVVIVALLEKLPEYVSPVPALLGENIKLSPISNSRIKSKEGIGVNAKGYPIG